MAVEIRQTTIESAKDMDVVQLYISDAERGDESASFVLEFQARLPKRDGASVLEQIQRDALKIAQDHLSEVRHGVTSKKLKEVDY